MFEFFALPLAGALLGKTCDREGVGNALTVIAQATYPGMFRDLGLASGEDNPEIPQVLPTVPEALPSVPVVPTAPKTAPKPTAPAPKATAPASGVVKATGVDAATALRLAPLVLQDLTDKNANYSRDAMSAFQKAAGLGVDGDYGPRTAGALKFYSGKTVPPSFGKYRKKGEPVIIDYTPGA